MRYPTDPTNRRRHAQAAMLTESGRAFYAGLDAADYYPDETGVCEPGCGHDVEHHGPRGCCVRGCRCERGLPTLLPSERCFAGGSSR